MKIGLGALLVHPLRFGGAETYARCLLDAIAQVDTENEYTVFLAKGTDYETSAPNFQVVKFNAPVGNPYLRVMWEHAVYPFKLKGYDVDLFHFLGSTAPFNFRRKSIVTIHETLRYQAPESAPWVLSKYYDMNQRHIQRSDKDVIAVSHFDADVMAEHVGFAKDRMQVVPLGVQDKFYQSPAEPHEKDYILWIGRNYVHKNVKVLLKAYALLEPRPSARLRLVGMTDSDRRQLAPLIHELGIEESVDLLSPVSHDQVPELLRGAKVFCFPSLYESFGLPILEAMASGTAVVCSELGCFRELFGDSVQYCDPKSPEQFAAAIKALLDDDGVRCAAEEQGRMKAREFTWEKCAERTIEVYRNVLAKTS